MTKRCFKLFLVAIILLSSIKITAQLNDQNKVGYETITQKDLEKHLTFLASDERNGRATGSEQCLISAMYIAKEFNKYGVKPIHKQKYKKKGKLDLSKRDLNTKYLKDFAHYFQQYNLQRSKLSDNCSLSFTFGDNNFTKKYSYQKDFFVQYKALETLELTKSIVFVGYGLEDEKNDYSDYKDANGNEIDIKGKVVLIVDGYPGQASPGSHYYGTKDLSVRQLRRKADVAFKKGALAVLVVNNPLITRAPISQTLGTLKDAFTKKFFSLDIAGRKNVAKIFMNDKIANQIFNQTIGTSLKDILVKMEDDKSSNAFVIGDIKVNMNLEFDYEIIPTQNVAGIIEGTDPELKDEVIVVGAHYDHIGRGEYGAMCSDCKGQIHNGADDNGSGTVGVIELAKAFSKNKPKRTIVFVAFSGEENGILGSRYYVYRDPIKPLDKTIAMVNLDMIGRCEDNLLWVGGAFDGVDIIEVVKKANETTKFELFYNLGLLNRASDQAGFLRKKIPALFFFTGMHDDYHAPTDVLEKINFPKLTQVAKLAYLTTWNLATDEVTPKYEKQTMPVKAKIVKESMSRLKKYRKK